MRTQKTVKNDGLFITAKNRQGVEHRLDARFVSHSGQFVPFAMDRAATDFCRIMGVNTSNAEQLQAARAEYGKLKGVYHAICQIAKSGLGNAMLDNLRVAFRSRPLNYRIDATYTAEEIPSSALALSEARAIAKANKLGKELPAVQALKPGRATALPVIPPKLQAPAPAPVKNGKPTVAPVAPATK